MSSLHLSAPAETQPACLLPACCTKCLKLHVLQVAAFAPASKPHYGSSLQPAVPDQDRGWHVHVINAQGSRASAALTSCLLQQQHVAFSPTMPVWLAFISYRLT